VRNVIDYALFICFFPQLVAGPIVRARNFFPDLWHWRAPSSADVSRGVFLVALGLTKKMAFADQFAKVASGYFSNVAANPGMVTAWSGVVAFGLQIYFDFSGYTDMAIGMALLLGFHFPVNFRRPYLASSITDFWRRWHISLSTWFKDYVYIPLGGNRVVKWRWYYNLFITFFISGLWHGANWTFAAWGALHGFYMVLDSLVAPGREQLRARLKLPALRTVFDGANLALTFALATIAWIPFRAANFSDAWYVCTHLFAGAGTWVHPGAVAVQFRGMGLKLPELIDSLAFIGIVVVYDWIDSRRLVWDWLKAQPQPLRWAVCYSVLLLVLFFGPYNQAQNFIYFQF
jgi:D-alanyl-lipoteichoic acid acyltransferase DltB (MBOAT superfamily)